MEKHSPVRISAYRIRYIVDFWPGFLIFKLQLRLFQGKPVVILVLLFIKTDQ